MVYTGIWRKTLLIAHIIHINPGMSHNLGHKQGPTEAKDKGLNFQQKPFQPHIFGRL